MSFLSARKFMTAITVLVLVFGSCPFVFVGAGTDAVRTYDFTDTVNNKAYEGEDPRLPPLTLGTGTEFGPASYSNISRLDSSVASYSSVLSEYHKFRFKIFESPAAISRLYVEHDGYGESRDPGLRLFIWNNASSYWDFLDEHAYASQGGMANATISREILRYIDADGYLYVLAQAKGGVASCPFLYSHNGERYVFVGDLYNRGILAVPGFRPQPEDYVKIEADQLRLKDGSYSLQIDQEYDEISYLDKVALITVDHSPDFNTFQSLLKGELGTTYTVGKVLVPPTSVVDENGRDVLQKIAEKDGVYTGGALNELKILDLNLGNLSGAKQVKLVISAYTNWDNEVVPKSDEQENRIGRFIQVKDANGNWVAVYKDFQIIAPTAIPRTYVLDMTGKFLTNDYSVRIGYYPDIRFDYIGIDTSRQQETAISSLAPIHADLHFRGYSDLNGFPSIPDYYQLTQNPPQHYSHPSGNFTRFGNVLPLLIDRDDKLAILHHGDEISLNFQYLPAVKGMERDFFLYSWGYYKGWDYATGNTVEPLPFHGMSSYPYPSNESYPSDSGHLAYLKEYNTREYSNEISNSTAGGHHTIYTDYVKVDVWSTDLSTASASTTQAADASTTHIAETSTHIVETSTTGLEKVTDVVAIAPYLGLLGTAAVIFAFFVIRKTRGR